MRFKIRPELKKLLNLLFCLSLITAQGQEPANVVTPHVDPSLKFSENLGQWDSRVLFRAQLAGGAVFIEKNRLSFNFYDRKKYASLHMGGLAKGEYSDYSLKGHAYRAEFLN